VKGGSQIEVESAGFTEGNYSLIKVNGEQVMTIQNKLSTATMSEATMSSNYRNGDLNEEASIPINANAG
jgi:hypothetical protein